MNIKTFLSDDSQTKHRRSGQERNRERTKLIKGLKRNRGGEENKQRTNTQRRSKSQTWGLGTHRQSRAGEDGSERRDKDRDKRGGGAERGHGGSGQGRRQGGVLVRKSVKVFYRRIIHITKGFTEYCIALYCYILLRIVLCYTVLYYATSYLTSFLRDQ